MGSGSTALFCAEESFSLKLLCAEKFLKEDKAAGLDSSEYIRRMAVYGSEADAEEL